MLCFEWAWIWGWSVSILGHLIISQASFSNFISNFRSSGPFFQKLYPHGERHVQINGIDIQEELQTAESFSWLRSWWCEVSNSTPPSSLLRSHLCQVFRTSFSGICVLCATMCTLSFFLPIKDLTMSSWARKHYKIRCQIISPSSFSDKLAQSVLLVHPGMQKHSLFRDSGLLPLFPG